ncbi:MAG: hypothetical protein KC420_13410, partial [Myxococcales bacterium]|nr:hypothetical protein [Myxococcales bacterium]
SSSSGDGPTNTGMTSPATSDVTEGPDTSMTGSSTGSESGPATSSTGGPPPSCGNGIVEPGEECDEGDANGPEAPCSDACVLGFCGDAIVQPALGEACDLGAGLNHEHGACTDECMDATCGDGKVFLGVEECDDGEQNQAGLYDGYTPMTCTLGPRCGDGELQKPQEECDLGEAQNGKEGTPCTGGCAIAGKMVFVTSKLYTGAIGMGGVTAADDACNTVAMEAGLANAGKFRAWISDGTSAPATWKIKPGGPFILPEAKGKIADTWADLTDGSLAMPIDVGEDGEVILDFQFAWTGTSPQGAPLASRCMDWTSAAKESFGRWGSLLVTDGGWTSVGDATCKASARLFCVEI